MHSTRTLPSSRILISLCCAIVFRGLGKAQDLPTAELFAPVAASFHRCISIEGPIEQHPSLRPFLRTGGVLNDKAPRQVGGLR